MDTRMRPRFSAGVHESPPGRVLGSESDRRPSSLATLLDGTAPGALGSRRNELARTRKTRPFDYQGLCLRRLIAAPDSRFLATLQQPLLWRLDGGGARPQGS